MRVSAGRSSTLWSGALSARPALAVMAIPLDPDCIPSGPMSRPPADCSMSRPSTKARLDKSRAKPVNDLESQRSSDRNLRRDRHRRRFRSCRDTDRDRHHHNRLLIRIRTRLCSCQTPRRQTKRPAPKCRPFPSLAKDSTNQKSPPWLCPPPPPAFSSLGFSATIASVVSIRPATDAAFCRAVRTTLAGSMTPIATRSPYSSVRAL